MDVSKYIIDVLRTDGEFVLGRGRNPATSSAASVLALAPAAEHPAPKLLRRLEHEYALSAELDAAWAVRPIQLTRNRGRSTLILEDPGGEPLDRLLGAPIELGQFLRIAIGLSAALRQLHGLGFIHKDIKPANALVDPKTGHVRLMGFGIASRLPRELQAPDPPEFIAGTLPYMAPEQTGRMNRSLDSRSDLYSLGVTLYEMLTGTLPFAAADPMEWVHCHIARQPVPPAERLKHLSALVSAIIMKLLAKTAEERYQTAAGLEHDLKHCLAQWTAQGSIDEFVLGARDTPDRLLISQKLYRRAREVDALLAAFDGVVKTGTPELVLISGYSGIGKSSVVNELHKVLVPPRGLFAAGKFDQYKRDVPYAPLAQAFQNLIRGLLSKSEAELVWWRDVLRQALDPNGQLMVDLVPELKLVIGEQPPVPELPPSDLQARFQLVFRRLLAAFARPEHPLVLFLDDLQWLDMATLDLLGHLVTSPEVRHVLLVGAYRENEVGPDHPLMQTVRAIQASRGRLREIVLASLQPEDVECLVADALRCEREYVRPLADLVFERTAGNPLFSVQFLTTLAEEGLLRFDTDGKVWRWDAGRISSKGYADNVLELMAAKLRRLSAETQRALMHCACLGHVADVRTVALLQGQSEDALHASLLGAVRAGLLVSVEGGYKFVHDRVHEAAYALIPPVDRGAAHLRIGRLLLERMSAPEVRDTVFELVNHLNAGLAFIADTDESDRLAELNLLAGQKAKAASAYASASRYLSIGMDLLGTAGWDRRYELAFGLWIEAAECEYLNGTLESAERLLSELLVRARSKLDRAAAYRLRIIFHMTNSAYQAAIDGGLECLGLFDIAIPSHPAREDFETEYENFWAHLAGRSIKSLIDLPLATAPECRAVAAVLTALFAPTSFINSNLFYMLICRGANLTLEHGVSEATTHIYSGLAQILGPIFHRYEDGLRFATLSYELAEKYGFGAAKAHFAMQNATVWCRPIQTAIDHTRLGSRLAADSSDLSYACYFSHRLVTCLLLQGSPLDMVSPQLQHGIALAHRIKFRDVADIMASQQAFIANMRGETKAFFSFDSAVFDEAAFEAGLTGRVPTLVCWYGILKLEAHFIFGDFATARAAARDAGALVSATQSFIQWMDYVYFGALSIAALHDERPDTQVDELGELQAHLVQLREWADACPATFLDKYLVVAAEIARLEGRDLDAMRLYERAIGAAHENGFVHNEAIACERASAFYRARGFDQFADIYLRKARHCYVSWGADGKVRQLDELYPNLAEKALTAQATSTIQAPVEHLDLATVIKVSQAVSVEIVLEKLIETLMRTALEHAGAERGLLLLPRGGELQVEAEARSSGDAVIVRVGEASLAAARRPELVVNYVLRTHEQVILDDASAEERFSADEYLREHRARSILCLPLLKQAKLIGILYLENNLVRHAFTPARSAVLRVLASEAAISLENSRLYRALEEREAKIRRLVDANIIGIFTWSLEGRILEANDAFLSMVGYDREDLVSGRIYWTDLTPPQWQDRDRQLVQELKLAGSLQPFEKEYFRKDGSRVPVLIGIANFEERGNQGVAFVLDLTERKRAEEASRESEGKFRDYAETASDWLWETGPDHKFTHLTENAFGSDPTSRIGTDRSDDALDLETEPEKWRLLRATLDARKPFRDFVYCCLGGNGSLMYVKASGKPVFDPKGEFRGYRGTGTDVTATMRAQRAEESLRAVQAELAHVSRVTTLGQLTASIAHEVKQPIGAARNNARAALNFLDQQSPDLGEVREALECVVDDADRAGDIIDRIRDHLKKTPPRRDRFDLNEAINEVIGLARSEMIKNGVSIQTRLCEGLPPVRGDRVQLQQVILNLILNAIEAMSSVVVEARGLSISAEQSKTGGILVAVRDSGPGIEPEHLERVFEAFYTTKSGGVGMGLSICRSIISAHGGRLWAETNEPRGALFQFTLPGADARS